MRWKPDFTNFTPQYILERAVGRAPPGTASHWRMQFDGSSILPLGINALFCFGVFILYAASPSFFLLAVLTYRQLLQSCVPPLLYLLFASICFVCWIWLERKWLSWCNGFAEEEEGIEQRRKNEDEYLSWMQRRSTGSFRIINALLLAAWLPFVVCLQAFTAVGLEILVSVQFLNDKTTPLKVYRLFVAVFLIIPLIQSFFYNDSYEKMSAKYLMGILTLMCIHEEILAYEVVFDENLSGEPVGGIGLPSMCDLWTVLCYRSPRGYRWQWMAACGILTMMFTSRLLAPNATLGWAVYKMISHLLVFFCSMMVAYNREYLSRLNFYHTVDLRRKGVVFFPLERHNVSGLPRSEDTFESATFASTSGFSGDTLEEEEEDKKWGEEMVEEEGEKMELPIEPAPDKASIPSVPIQATYQETRIDRLVEYLSVDILNIWHTTRPRGSLRKRDKYSKAFRSSKVEEIFTTWHAKRTWYRVRVGAVLFVIGEALLGIYDFLVVQPMLTPVQFREVVFLRYVLLIPLTAILAWAVCMSSPEQKDDFVSWMIVVNGAVLVFMLMETYSWVNSVELWQALSGMLSGSLFRLQMHASTTFRVKLVKATSVSLAVGIFHIIGHFVSRNHSHGPVEIFPAIIVALVFVGWGVTSMEEGRYRDQFALREIRKRHSQRVVSR